MAIVSAARFRPPNQPSLSYPVRTAFDSLTAYLAALQGDISIYDTDAAVKTATLLRPVGTMAMSLGTETGVTAFYVKITQGWLIWDAAPVLYMSNEGSLNVGGVPDNVWAANPSYTLGNGASFASYQRVGSHCQVQYGIAYGSTSTAGGLTGLVLPFDSDATALPGFGFLPNATWGIGNATYVDAGAPNQGYVGEVRVESASTFRILPLNTTHASGFLTDQGGSATIPFTFGAADEAHCRFIYQMDNLL